jgi:ornithine cyclodeaminase
MRLIGAHDAQTALARIDVVRVVADALAAYSRGAADVPRRLRVTAGEEWRESLVMPGYLADPPVLGLKVVNGFAAGPRDPTVTHAVMLLVDLDTGETEAVIEASRLTAIRTAAMTRLAFDFAAPQGVRVVAMIGAGVQAHAHAEILADAFPDLVELRVHSRTHARAEELASTAGNGAFRARAVRSAEAAVDGADVVVAATTAHEPVFEDGWLASGALVCGIGTHTPDAAEIPPATIARAEAVIVDTRPGGVHGAGDIARPLASSAVAEGAIVELGELVAGTRSVAARDGGVTVFKSVGTAAVDLPLAAQVLATARQAGLGLEVDFT